METISEQEEDTFSEQQSSRMRSSGDEDSDLNEERRSVGIFEDFVLLQELLCLELEIRVCCIKSIRTNQHLSPLQESQEATGSFAPSKDYLKITSVEELKDHVNTQLEFVLKERIWLLKDTNKRTENKGRLGM